MHVPILPCDRPPTQLSARWCWHTSRRGGGWLARPGDCGSTYHLCRNMAGGLMVRKRDKGAPRARTLWTSAPEELAAILHDLGIKLPLTPE